jgi:uncharacterized protein (DUF427 family)
MVEKESEGVMPLPYSVPEHHSHYVHFVVVPADSRLAFDLSWQVIRVDGTVVWSDHRKISIWEMAHPPVHIIPVIEVANKAWETFVM